MLPQCIFCQFGGLVRKWTMTMSAHVIAYPPIFATLTTYVTLFTIFSFLKIRYLELVMDSATVAEHLQTTYNGTTRCSVF